MWAECPAPCPACPDAERAAGEGAGLSSSQLRSRTVTLTVFGASLIPKMSR